MLGNISTRTKVLFGIGLIAAIAFIIGDQDLLDIYWLRMVTKPIPVLLMAIYLLTLSGKRSFQWLVIVGLLLGMTGDILLEYSEATFLLGLIAFLLGHIFYILAFLTDSRKPGLGYAIFVYLYGIAVYGFLETGDLGKMALPVMLYILVITTMVWRASARYHAPGVNHESARAGIIGSLLFLASDSLLAVTLFVYPIPYAGIVVIITYWLGQLGITIAAQKAQLQSAPGLETAA
jgi:uncharacterized membrane protein YhhN